MYFILFKEELPKEIQEFMEGYLPVSGINLQVPRIETIKALENISNISNMIQKDNTLYVLMQNQLKSVNLENLRVKNKIQIILNKRCISIR